MKTDKTELERRLGKHRGRIESSLGAEENDSAEEEKT